MTTKTIFHPYKVIGQTEGFLELDSKSGALLWFLRLIPLIVPIIFIFVIASTDGPIQAELVYAAIGVTLFLYLILAFIKSPSSVRLDTLGMKVKYVSIMGYNEKDVQWSDVDRLEYIFKRGKGGGYYIYRAVTNDKKKIKFLQFPGYNLTTENIPAVNAAIESLSKKTVVKK